MTATDGATFTNPDTPIAPPPISRWATMGLGIAILFFTVTAALSYRNQKRFVATESLATDSRLLVSEVTKLSSLLQTAETSQRAYFMTNRVEFLDSYAKAVQDIPTRFIEIRKLAISTDQRSAISVIEQAAQQRLTSLRNTLELYEQEGLEAAQNELATGSGHRLMQLFREKVESFNDVERGIVSKRQREARRALRITHVTDLLAAALGLGLAALAFVQLRREFLRRYAIAQTLDEQRDLLQVTLHSIGDAVVTTDAHGRVRTVNAVAERLLGWPSAQAVGRPLAEGFRTFDARSRQQRENPALRAIQDGQGVRQTQNTLLVARDNTERRIDGSAAPIRTTDGRVLGAVLTFRDVTDRKQSEDALRRSEERLRRALQASRMVAWEIDLRTDVVVRSENVAELIGLPPFGPITEYLDIIHPEDRADVETALGRAMRGEAEYAIDCRITLTDGRILWVADRGEVRRNHHDEPTHVVGVLMDITDVKRAEEELREADRRKDHFLATLAHELRNPLAPISNVVQAWPFVKDNPIELERLRETLDRQVGQMSRLIDDLLDVSRITRDKITLRKERGSVKFVLDAAIEGVRPLLNARRHDLRVGIPDPSPMIEGDLARLVQVFTNLIHNAAKYTDEGGRIEVAVRTPETTADQPGQVVVSIKDNGPGIPRAMLERIFELFSQVDQTLERSHGGLGIGLTLVKSLVERHGGRIEAMSDGPGTGCTFTTTLPLATNAPEAAATDAAPTADQLPTLRMLVVDDMRPSARTLAMMLKGIGQETQVAHDGLSALAAVEDFRPDVVLLDIAMPGMDGYEVCRRLRERQGHQPMLVALTGYGQDEDRRRAFDAGFDKHLVKPTSLDALRALLAEARPVAQETPATE